MSKPRINIVSEGTPQSTKVFTEDGTDISDAISEITLHLSTKDVNTASLKAVLVGADIDAEIVELQTRVLPPPQPRVQYRFRITEGSRTADKWSLEKLTPLPTYGVREEWIAGGALALGSPLIEIVDDAPESEPERSGELPDENVIYGE